MTPRERDEDFSSRDVPSPIDLRDPQDAQTWVDEADRKRPWHADFRARIAHELAGHGVKGKLLELGAGPGLLAACVLERVRLAQYVLHDFSEPMFAMARARLAGHGEAAFVLGDFRLPGWSAALPAPFDAIVAMQSVHEIRHKRHVPGLYATLRGLLSPGGVLLICDHAPGSDSSRVRNLMMTEAEQHAGLRAAGFEGVSTLLERDKLYLYRALAGC